jgi:hypothetical protein
MDEAARSASFSVRQRLHEDSSGETYHAAAVTKGAVKWDGASHFQDGKAKPNTIVPRGCAWHGAR